MPLESKNKKFLDASSRGDLHTIQEMLSCLVSPSAGVCVGKTPLHLAAKYGHAEIVSLLLNHQKSASDEDDRGNTPLDLAVYEGHYEVALRLLKFDASLASHNNGRSTPLHLAAVKGRGRIIRLLLNHGASVSAEDKNGRTPLSLAVYKGQTNAVRVLLKPNYLPSTLAKIDLNKQLDNGDTVLHLAASKGHTDTVKRLLSEKVDITLKNNDDDTAIAIAALKSHFEIVQELLDAGAVKDKNIQTLMQWAVIKEQEDPLKVLAKEGTNVNKTFANGQTMLHLAAMDGHNDAVNTLLCSGADIALRDDSDNTSLHLAAVNGNSDVVKTLLRGGINPTEINKHRKTALHLASQYGHKETVQALLDADSDICDQDEDGNTPLHLAVKKEHETIVPLLLTCVGTALGMTNKKEEMPADEVKPTSLKKGLDECVEQSTHRFPQAKNIITEVDDIFRFMRQERKSLLKKVTWSFNLFLILRDHWSLSEESLAWLWGQEIKENWPWRHQMKKDKINSHCDIFHPVDAILARCLVEDNQTELGQSLKKRLIVSESQWVSVWNKLDDLVELTEADSSEEPGTLNRMSVSMSKQNLLKHSLLSQYQMKKQPSGIALIINNVEFKNRNEPRHGAKQDEESLRSVLIKIGFHVRVKNNLIAADMMEAVKDFATLPKHKDGDAAILAIMSHGNEQCIYGTDDQKEDIEDIIGCFSNKKAPLLCGKPKWFILSACRGPQENRPEWSSDGGKFVPPCSDIYITYSTIPGHKSMRSHKTGSWMINILCKYLEKHWQSLSLHEIHLLVNQEMTSNYTLPMGSKPYRPIQIMETAQRGWRKLLYFRGDAADRMTPNMSLQCDPNDGEDPIHQEQEEQEENTARFREDPFEDPWDEIIKLTKIFVFVAVVFFVFGVFAFAKISQHF